MALRSRGIRRARDYRRDPASLLSAAGLAPDPWQRQFLGSAERRVLMLITRQGGKSTTTAAKALHTGLYRAGSLTLIVAPTERQSKELLEKVATLYFASGQPVQAESLAKHEMRLANGSRIVALPGKEKTIRGFSAVDLLIIDEAARVDDSLYYSVRPMLAVSGGSLVALSTPAGKRGFFYEEYTSGGDDWQRIRVTARACPRITDAFLDEERRRLPDAWFRAEYLCEFTETAGSLFREEDILAAFSDEVSAYTFDLDRAPENGTAMAYDL